MCPRAWPVTPQRSPDLRARRVQLFPIISTPNWEIIFIILLVTYTEAGACFILPQPTLVSNDRGRRQGEEISGLLFCKVAPFKFFYPVPRSNHNFMCRGGLQLPWYEPYLKIRCKYAFSHRTVMKFVKCSVRAGQDQKVLTECLGNELCVPFSCLGDTIKWEGGRLGADSARQIC